MIAKISFIRPLLCAAFLTAFTVYSSPLLAAESGNEAQEQARTLGQNTSAKPLSKNTDPKAQWFPAAGLGLFIHWGIVSQTATSDLSWSMLANKPWYDNTITPNAYYAGIKKWNPAKMDYDKILSAAKAAGVNYAVMVTKHHDGFTLWPSAFGDIGTKFSFQGRDFVKEFVTACRKHKLKVGLYYSPPDWWFDRKYRSFSYTGPALDMDHLPTTLPPRPADHEASRKHLVRGQITELLSNYGQIDLFWFDGGKGEMPNAEVRRLQPGIVINKRNGGAGDYGDSEVSLPATRFSGWFETCATCWPSKKWSYREEYGFDDAPMALTKLVLLRAWGGNLLANVGPKGDGSVPDAAYNCWADMAKWMAHSRESVENIKPGPWPGPVNLPVTTREGIAYIHFLPKFPETYPNTPPQERKMTKTKEVLRPLPEYSDTAVWQNAPKPAMATLLRTGKSLPFKYEKGTFTLTIPPNLRTESVDVVKVDWEK